MDAYGGDEESAELRKLLAELNDDPDNFDSWEKLVKCAESLEGGLNRNSSSQAITAFRSAYDRFLAKFPLLFGYWRKYAELEFSIAGTEAAELIYERGISSITNSVDLWSHYCQFKTETCHDPAVIRELFERGANSVGLDFLSHPFWDKYIEFEDRWSQQDHVFRLLERIVSIPMHQYARYFEKYRSMAQHQPLASLVPTATLQRLQTELENEGAGYKSGRSQIEVEGELRHRVDAYHLNVFHTTQSETTKRWTYEQEIKRPYFHVTELDEGQLSNWRKYLDFEEVEGDYTRTAFLYERCLVTCAQHDEFWLRYARWMFAQDGKEEEVRNIYQRASCLFVPIALPEIRLQYAYFEEMTGRVDVAKAIHEAILIELPSHVETIVSWANTCRRHDGLDAAIAVFTVQLENPVCSLAAKASVVAEWAKLLYKVTGSADEARKIFQKHQQYYIDSGAFWKSHLRFEIEQPFTAAQQETHYKQVKHVVNEILTKTKLSAAILQELIMVYMKYLLELGNSEAAKEYMELDREVKGPSSVQKLLKTKSSLDTAGVGKGLGLITNLNGKARTPQISR